MRSARRHRTRRRCRRRSPGPARGGDVILTRPRAGGRGRLIAALDTQDADRAVALAGALAADCGLLKVGLELFAAHGPAAVERVTAAGAPRGTAVFLDLKLHDIPNTVAGAVRAVLPLRPAML